VPCMWKDINRRPERREEEDPGNESDGGEREEIADYLSNEKGSRL